MKSIHTTALLGVSFLALATPMSAIAQTTPAATEEPAATDQPAAADQPAATEAAGTSDEDIVVTARRRQENVQDVPAVVNAVTAQEVQQLNLRDFTEVQTLVPGLSLSNNANGIGGNAQIRGVNFDVNASGNNPTVEFYQNDAPITAGVVLQQMYDVGQIEVLRGPQGTLRGRASPSGSITVTTRKPNLYEAGGYVSLTGTDTETMNINGAVGIPILPGYLAVRVAGLYDVGDANHVRTIDNSFDGRGPYGRSESGRISILATPTDWLRLEGVYQRIDRFFRNYNQVESFNLVNPAAPPSPVLIEADDFLGFQALPRVISQVFDIYNWRAELSFAGQSLIYQGQHYTQALRSAESQDPGNVFPTTDTYQNTRSDISSTSHEIRLQNQERVLGIFDYAAGFFDNKNDTPTTLNRPTVVRLPLVFGGGVATVVQTAIERTGSSHEQSFFGNLTAHIGDSFQLSGGLRHIDYEDNGQLRVNGALLSNDVQDESRWIYSASAQYFFTRDIMVYASTGSSFRPGINAVGDFNIAQSALEQSFLNLPAETSRSYELGLKTTLFDRRLRFNITGYHQTFNNFPYRSPAGVFFVNTVPTAGGPVQQVAQFNFVAAVPVEVNGVEGEVEFNITPRWNVGIVASYSLGKIKNGTIPCNDLNGDGVPDVVTTAPTLAQLQAAVGADNLSACQVTQRSAFLPPFSASIQSEYSHPLNGHIDGFLRGLLTFNGASQGDPTSQFDDADAYALLNLFTGIRDPDGRWEFTFYVKNLFDMNRVLSRGDPLSTSYQQLGFGGFGPTGPIFTGPTATTFTSTYTGISTTPPREFGLNLRFNFGSR